jgi:rSAM/selenodomain-associated transferase 1
MRKALLVIAKAPVAGSVKTRLGALFSQELTAEFYVCLMRDTLALAERVSGVDRCVLFAPDDAEVYFRSLAPSFQLHPQRGADLNSRLLHAFEDYLGKGYTHVVIMDSDSPTLPARYLERAFGLLEEHDVVLGPCEDGGYYLIGAKAAHPELFLGLQMSTPRVFAETAARAESAGLQLGRLPLWYDVDFAADVRRLRSELCSDGRAAVHTAEFLRRHFPEDSTIRKE